MPKTILYHLRMGPFGNGEGRGRVPKIMEPQRLQPGAANGRLKDAADEMTAD